jgi:hypothetical protein
MIKPIFMRYLFVFLIAAVPLMAERLNFVTATDTEHFSWTINLIESIQRHHEKEEVEIAIFDLGLLPHERETLSHSAHIYDVDIVHPALLEKFTVDSHGKIARGCYAWKPVVIKQASDIFYRFLYLDSGITVTGPLHLLFQHIDEHGHFLIDCGHSIGRMTTKPLIAHFGLTEEILDQSGISAGIQGLSRPWTSRYIDPIFVLAERFTPFQDDGSCPKGFGWARHDQTLFSIQARLLGLPVQNALQGKKLHLSIRGKDFFIPFAACFAITRGKFKNE